MTLPNSMLLLIVDAHAIWCPFINILLCTHQVASLTYIILADKSLVTCLGRGIIHFTLGNKQIILHDVLHVPHLWNPLLSARCFCHLQGCSFIADTLGSFLRFPNFIIPVDDSSDCIIPGLSSNTSVSVDFDSRLIGSVASVSDNTWFQVSQWPILPSKTRHPTTTSSSANVSPSSTTLPSVATPLQDTLPPIAEQDDDILPRTDLLSCEHSSPEPYNVSLCSSSEVSGHLSSKQTQELATRITNYIEQHGRSDFSMFYSLQALLWSLLQLLLMVILLCYLQTKCQILLPLIPDLQFNNFHATWVFIPWKTGIYSNPPFCWCNLQKLCWN